MKPTNQHREPDFQAACQWWNDLPDVWTPIGWKSHLFRFNVFYNGCLLAQPATNRRSEAWAGRGVQVAVPRPALDFGDDDQVHQGWNDSVAPVLWSDWVEAGLLFKQEVFAHVPGGGDVQSGIEPLFAWVRVRIIACCPTLPSEPTRKFPVRINAPHIETSMSIRGNARLSSDRAAYPHPLVGKAASDHPGAAFYVMERHDWVRLAVAPATSENRTITFVPRQPDGLHDFLSVEVPAQVGAGFDLLVPMIPCDRPLFDRELALGYDAALTEANRYWKATQSQSSATVTTPEPFVNETIRHSLKFAEVIAEKNPADGEYSLLSGSLTYANLWTTPFAMNAVMLMSTMGYHREVGKYLDIFRRQQGTVLPPGDAFELHPGYLSTPAALKSIDWLSDHGAVLYTLSAHALLSGDQDFVERFQECIVKGCQFIRDARRITGHGGIEGILPPAVATDACSRIQGVWNDGWNYKGLVTAVRVLKQAGHPAAAEFEAEASDYRERYAAVYSQACQSAPTWTDRRGRKHPLTPTMVYSQKEVNAAAETRHAFYLDGGPLFLVFAGLFDAGHPLMKSTLAWFREGPQTKWYRSHQGDGHCWQIPCLRHEMSSCEPCYSWNVFHSWQSGDRAKFLEGMYSLYAGSLSRETYISCETRGGITGTLFSAPLAVYLTRLAVIDDQLAANELHLLRLMPLAWLKPGDETRFEAVPTEFGPVTVRTKMARDGQALAVTFTPAFRHSPGRILLHIPPVAGLRKLSLNGKKIALNRPVVTVGAPEGARR